MFVPFDLFKKATGNPPHVNQEYTATRAHLPSAADLYELTKPGITLFVMLSMAIGYVMGSSVAVAGTGAAEVTAGIGSGWLPFRFDVGRFAWALAGTWLIAAGTAAHNMYLERGLDGLMRRTAGRPLPAERVSESQARMFSYSLMVLGLAVMAALVNPAAALVSLATTVIYLGAYTPLKRITPANVFLGAVPGALPVVGGWAAATGHVHDYGMWILFWIMFLWQVPHVMAIAWLNREDYAHAGFQMLPRHDPSGLKATSWVLISLLCLLPNVWKLGVLGLGGTIWTVGAGLFTLGYLLTGVQFAFRRERAEARRMMFASFLYLPGIWLVLFIDRLVAWITGA